MSKIRTTLATFIALTLATTLTSTGTAAAASPWPKPVVTIADTLHCKHRVSSADGEGGTGLSCTVTTKTGKRQRYVILRHADTQHGIDWWRWFIDDGGYFAHRGHVLIIPVGTRRTPAYTEKWARWAVARVDGARLIKG